MNEVEEVKNILSNFKASTHNAILLINYNNLGDLICDTPSLRNIRKNYKDKKIVMLVRNEACIELMKNCPYVDELIQIPHSRDTIDIYYEFCKRLKKYSFDFSIQFVRPFEEFYRTYIPYMLGIKKRYGLIQKSYKEKYLKAFTNYVELDNNTTRTEESLKILKLLNIDIDNDQTECWYDATKVEHYKHKNYIIVQTCATMKCRMWHKIYFIDLIKKLLEYDSSLEILLTGSPKEDEYIDGIFKECNSERVFKYTNLNIDTLLNYIKNARLLVTNDTGPYHFARAFDTKRVVIFGVSPKEYLIKNKEKNSIELSGSNICKKNCPIKKLEDDCVSTYKKFGDNYNCINTVSVKQVLDSAIHLLEEL